MLHITDLRVCGTVRPLSVIPESAYVSWKIYADGIGVFQKSYQIDLVCDGKTVYNSGRIESAEQVGISLSKACLQNGKHYTLSLTVSDDGNREATAETVFSTAYAGLPQVWLRPAAQLSGQAIFLKKVFSVDSGVQRATLSASVLGYGDFFLDGVPICDHYFDTATANFEKTVLWRAYDMTALLTKGEHALTVHAGDGFWAQTRVWAKGTRHGAKFPPYGQIPCLWAAMVIEYENGERVLISTADEGWLTAPSPIVLNNIYAGEMYDARRELPDMATVSSGASWTAAEIDETPKGKLTPTLLPPCRLLEIIPARQVYCPLGRQGENVCIFDFGVNFAGTVRLRIPACPAGTQITVRLAESLTESGQIDIRSIGSSATLNIQQDTYIAKGDPDGEIWEPSFSYKSFRYAEITGLFTDRPDSLLAIGLAISSDLPEKSYFTCGHYELNRLLEVTRRTFRSNCHSYPEDCPGREKCGWLGDAQWCSEFWLLHYDSAVMLDKYTHDIADSYDVYGYVPMIAPGRRNCGEASPLWGLAIVRIPYLLWQLRGTTDTLRFAYPYMKRWLDGELAKLGDGELPKTGLGDWLPPFGNKDERRAPVAHTSAIAYIDGARMISEIASFFGRTKESVYYRDCAERLKMLFNRVYYREAEGSYGYDATDAAALELKLTPDPERTFKALCKRIEHQSGAMTCGAWGNVYLLSVLTERGRADLALRVMFSEGNINFHSLLSQGGTTLWEQLNQGAVGKPTDEKSGSYNHPMHGACMRFLYTSLAGIRPLAPGFAVFSFSPSGYTEVGGFTARLDTPYGEIEANVTQTGRVSLTVPCGTVCRCNGSELRPGVYHFSL